MAHAPDALQLAHRLAARLEADAPAADSAGAIAADTWAAVAASGFPAAALPKRLGGTGLLDADRSDDLFALLRVLGGADLNWARLCEGHINAVGLVLRFGTPAQAEALAARLHQGAFSAVWGADDADGLRTSAAPDGLRLHGRKILASGAGLVTLPLVTARTGDGPLLLLLDLAPGERADLSGWTPQGMRSSATGSIDLDGLHVPAARVIGRPGDFLRQPTLSGGAWRFCAAHLGAAERLVDLFRAQLAARGRGDDPYQIQRLAAAVAATTTAAFWVREAARMFAGAEAPPWDVVAFANLTRTVTERAALDVIEIVHRGAGLGSFLRPDPIERVARDLATYLRQPVPDLAMAEAGRAVLAAKGPIRELWRFA